MKKVIVEHVPANEIKLKDALHEGYHFGYLTNANNPAILTVMHGKYGFVYLDNLILAFGRANMVFESNVRQNAIANAMKAGRTVYADPNLNTLLRGLYEISNTEND